MLVGWPIASALSGRLLIVVGTRRSCVSGSRSSRSWRSRSTVLVHGGAHANALRAAMFTFGIGMGLANTALIITVQDSVRFARRGVATASTMFFRTIGGAVAVGVLGAVLAHALAGHVPESGARRAPRPRSRSFARRDRGRSLSRRNAIRHGADLPRARRARGARCAARNALPARLAARADSLFERNDHRRVIARPKSRITRKSRARSANAGDART